MHLILLSIALSVVHFIVLAICLVVSIGVGMHRFDHPELEESSLEMTLGATTELLMEPAFYLLSRGWPDTGIPDIIEWPAIVMNSCIWGFALTLIVIALKKSLSSNRRSES